MEVESDQTRKAEVSLTHPVVGSMCLPIERQHERGRVLGDGVRGDGRYSGDRDADLAAVRRSTLLNPAQRKAIRPTPYPASRSSTALPRSSLTNAHTIGNPAARRAVRGADFGSGYRWPRSRPRRGSK